MSSRYPYVSLARVLAHEPEAAARGVSHVARSPRGFVAAYREVGRAALLSEHWRRKRDAFVARHLAQALAHGERWRDGDGRLSRRALALLMWAYDPEARR